MKKSALLLFPWLIAFSACHQKQNNKLTVAIAANMQFAMDELSKTFTNETGITCELIIGSSGKLTSQIEAGAPFDIFISADMKYPDKLFSSGHATHEPRVYAYGKLVMWSMINGLIPSMSLLNDSEVHHIALANPKTAPYGMAAIEVLNHSGIFEKVKDKLVYGESILQTNQFIISKAAEIGFTAKSVVLSPEMKGKGNWIDIDEANYTPIAQGVVVLNHNKIHHANAEKFYHFLFTEKAKDILKKYGYAVK